ncbi:MAG TPA: hypothetical protein VK327_18370, partial [Candidatus Paceibacterota bacterium]|nr:hypothetical protein [Candidatus Paceibacterota bacterium]
DLMVGALFNDKTAGDNRLADMLMVVHADTYGWEVPTIDSGLDSAPYPLTNTTYGDGPGVGITVADWNGVVANGTFETILMFKPDGDSIPVPLRRVFWGWTGEAHKTNNIWSLVTNACWHSVNPDDADWRQFPTWPKHMNSTP